MTRPGAQGLAMVGVFVVVLTATCAAVIRWDQRGVLGTVVGTALGLLNLAVGSFVTRRALRSGTSSVVATKAGGFIARFAVLVVLMVAFQRTDGVDPAAFGLTFLVLFFVYLGVEMLLVDRSLAAGAGVGPAHRVGKAT